MSAESPDTMDMAESDRLPAFSKAPVGAMMGRIAAAMSAIGTVGIGALMLLIVADVIGRNFLDAPITGVAEIAARGVVAIVFLQLAAAILQGRLTRADFLIRRIEARSPRALALIEATFCLAGAAVFAVLLWPSWPKFIESWQSMDFFGVQGVFTIPTWPFRGITVLGSGMAMLAAIYRATRALARLRERS